MIAPAFPRRLAALLLQGAVSIAPPDTLEWGQAMLGELRHVEGNWSALFWSLGSAGVLAKHALVALIFPSASIPSGGEFFSKEGPMRKPALIVIASCVVASLLLFLAPVFRQAFGVSLAQWHDVLNVTPKWTGEESNPGLEALARKAEQNHDAEALAFVAGRIRNRPESVRLADEAVRLDPTLTWVYGVLAVQWSSFPELDRWAPALKKYDPENALPHLIVAERIDIEQVDHESVPRRAQDEPTAWKDAMSAAFRSQKLDTYVDRVKELDRRVLVRYHVDDPFDVLVDHDWYAYPSYAAWDASRYAQLLLEAGEALEASGDRKGAFGNYSIVVRFTQMMGHGGSFLMAECLHDAYARLASLSEKGGDHEQAQLYAFLAGPPDRARNEEIAYLRAELGPRDGARWSASMARVSGVALLSSGTVLFVCVVSLLVRRRSLRLAALQPSGRTLALGVGAAITALLSSGLLYASYRPYAETVQRFLRTGDESGMRDLSDFLAYSQTPLGTGMNVGKDFLAQDFAFYFWLVVAVLCGVSLLVALLRHIQTRQRVHTAA